MNEPWQYGLQAQAMQAAAKPLMTPQREPTVAEAIDRALANGEQQRVRLMKLRGIMEQMAMLDKPVHELHTLPADHPARNKPLDGCWTKWNAGGAWRQIMSSWGIARHPYNALGPTWTETSVFCWEPERKTT